MKSEKTLNGIKVVIESEKDIDMSDNEIQAYIDRFSNHNTTKQLAGLEIKVDGDDVELTYEQAPQNFERIRRITGYLVGDMSRWNNAKSAEEVDRVKHTVNETVDTYDVALYVKCENEKSTKGVLAELEKNNRVGYVFAVMQDEQTGRAFYAPESFKNYEGSCLGFIVSNKDILNDAVAAGVIDDVNLGIDSEQHSSQLEDVYPAYKHLLEHKIECRLEVGIDYLVARCEISNHSHENSKSHDVKRDGMENYIKNKSGERVYLSDEEVKHFKAKGDDRNAIASKSGDKTPDTASVNLDKQVR